MNRTFLKYIGRALLVVFVGASAHAGVTDIASAPLVTSSASAVGPNLMMLLDDSGSMAWNYLPDWATTSNNAAFDNNVFNGVAYSAAVTYSAPVYFNSDGTVNTTTYPSMTSANSSAWTLVPNDGYKVQSTSKSNLVGNASFYTFVAGEYCDKPNPENCVLQLAPSPAYPYPATLRWCTTDAMSYCHAVRIETGTTYLIPRSPPLAATATITVKDTNSITITVAAPSGATSTSVIRHHGERRADHEGSHHRFDQYHHRRQRYRDQHQQLHGRHGRLQPQRRKDYVATSSSNVVTVTGTAIADTTVVVSATAPAAGKPLTFTVAYIGATTSTTVSAVTIPSYTRLDGPRLHPTICYRGEVSPWPRERPPVRPLSTPLPPTSKQHQPLPHHSFLRRRLHRHRTNNVVTITAPLGISVTPTVTKESAA